MDNAPRAHGFTAVDGQPDPQRWVRCLDIVHSHRFFAAYKRRIHELLHPACDGLYLDVGAGTGDDALRLTRACGAVVFAIDESYTMAVEARRRGLPTSLVGAASRLPFSDGMFDGCWADRVFQHLESPEKSLAELVRVTRPQGRIVVVDPDYSTQTIDLPDQLLAEKTLRFRAEWGLRNGTLAGRMANLFMDIGLADVRSEARTLTVRDATELDNVFGIRTWARSARRVGLLSDHEVVRWEALIDEAVASGCFSWQVTFILTTGIRRP